MPCGGGGEKERNREGQPQRRVSGGRVRIVVPVQGSGTGAPPPLRRGILDRARASSWCFASTSATGVATERFAAADTNGDGGLSLEEIEAFREAEREHRMEMRKQRMFDRQDTNGDGVISIDEFESRGMPMFERIDADGDGEITEAELSEMKGHRGHRRGGWHHRGERPVQE